MSTEPNWSEVGARIVTACVKKGFKHHWQLANAIGPDDDGRVVPTSTISRWKNGKQPPTRYLSRIARALDVTQDWLAWGDAGAPRRDLDAEAVERARELLERRGFVVVKQVAAEGSGIQEIAPKRGGVRRRPATGARR